MKKVAAIFTVVLLGALGLAGCDSNSPDVKRNQKEIQECRANPNKVGCPTPNPVG
jgi:hypothetical protein